MVTDWSFLLLALSFGVILGVFNTIGTVIDPILDAFNMTSASSFVGAMFIVGGLIGSILFGVFLDCTKKFKIALIMVNVGSLIVMTLFTFLIKLEITYVTIIAAFFIGNIMLPIFPVALEFACELTFPIGEALSDGFLLTTG